MTTYDFTSHRRDIERKAAAAQKDIAGLLGIDGQPVFQPEHHEEQKARALAPLRQSVSEVLDLWQQAQIEARRLEALAHSDPLANLSNEEVQRLNAARELAQADIQGLSRAELASRLLTVTHSGDIVSGRLHLLYAKAAVVASDDENLHRLYGGLDQAINGKERAKAEKAAEQAERLRKESAELVDYAGRTLAELDGSAADAQQRRLQEYSGIF